ncbi:hypothetical protein DY000_02020575 [Brassica cretica]|uniref:Uncharacterized protein n=1 Tax=Brassica cretica TaxID=69181 RepID=A0ABQ7ENR9_BRACR|nr:hypothetical protein DY000_02020575 [Brassica cretica]
MEGSPYQKFSISRGKGAVLGAGPGIIRSGELGFLLAGILGTGVPSSGDPEAGVLPGIWRNSIPEYFSPTASLRQDIAPVVLRSRVPFRSEPYSEPGGGSVSPISDMGLVLLGPLHLFPSSLVGGRTRPCLPFTDPFSSPVPSWGDVREADSEAVSMAPLRRLCPCFFDDGPRAEIREGDCRNP